jgi:hypothetical protein
VIGQPLRVPSSQLWEQAEQIEPYWVYERRRRRRRLLVSLSLTLALVAVCLIAFTVLNARQNYVAGKRALLAGEYDLAIRRLGAATIVGRPWADSRTLLGEALTLTNGQVRAQSTLLSDEPPTAATLTLRQAAALFATGHYAAARDMAADLQVRVPTAAAARLAQASNVAVSSLLLLITAERLLAVGDWRTAATDASLVLAHYPRCGPASSLAAEAARRGAAAPLYARALSLADAHRWTLARSAVRHALAVDPAYPGASALLTRIDNAIAARNAARAAAAASSSSSSSGGSGTTSPPTSSAPPPP